MPTPSRARRLVAALATCLVAGAVVLPVPPAGALPSLPNVDKQYWFGNYRIGELWKLGATGRGVTVAVLDTGVRPGRELSGVVLSGTDLHGGDGRTDTDRELGHGTSMARYIAGQGGGPLDLTGIAPESKILPVTVNDNDNGTADTYSRGIRYAVDHGARVINVSQGIDGSGEPDHCPASVAAAVRYALDKNRIVVAASGNEATEGNAPNYPAACPGVVAVGAVNGSKAAWPDSQRQSYVDVAAPGVAMPDETPSGETGTSSGTSNSAALVSASAALVWSKFPELTNRQVVARLLASVTDDTSVKGKDDVTGYGIVRPYFAVTDKVPADAPNPIFDEVSGGSGSPSSGSSSGTASSSSPGAPVSRTPGTGALPAQSDDDSGVSPTVWIVGGVVAALVVLAIALVVARTRRPQPSQGPPPGPWSAPPPPGNR